MEALFNIDDYDNDEENELQTTHDHLIPHHKLDNVEEPIKKEAKEIVSEHQVDEIIMPEKKHPKIHAVDDKIDVKEYDKIIEPAITFPFELDIFQKRSIIRLENHEVSQPC